ncbi:hypothetical protein SAMN02799622_02033 [Methylobacterium sp. UNC378MF]|uniref:hypothetical protein n=1 Tax=Methylobacterium sp. UNC378MF TaxID=1502748 RepID=UPI00088D42D7|nr:hypothetical protein [Methylobacterium sp. UNC378MF]SDA18449.1 hypothetical protein SAMN02799622_02033 [Methylobacterium sp. UNC378MF]
MEFDAGDFATLQQHYERLWALYTEFEQSRSTEIVKAMQSTCRSARRVTNPRYRYAIEQLGWIEGALRPKPTGHDLYAIHQAIMRLENAVTRLKP